MVKRLLWHVKLLDIDSTAISSTLALPERALEPDDGIEATLDQKLGGNLFASGLH